jgi:hypothetical protein
MAFSLIVADETGAVQDHEKTELASMEHAPSSLAADQARSPEKDAIDFRNLSIQPSRGAGQLDGRFVNRRLTSGRGVRRCKAPSDRSQAIHSCGHQWLEPAILVGSDSWLFSSTIPPRFAKTSAISTVRSPGGASKIRSASTSVTVVGLFASQMARQHFVDVAMQAVGHAVSLYVEIGVAARSGQPIN